MNNADLIQQVATLNWLLDQNNSALYLLVTGGRVTHELYQRLTASRQEDLLKQLAVAKIAAYVQKHPHAREEELVNVVKAELDSFKASIAAV
jgi:hypothetical protein